MTKHFKIQISFLARQRGFWGDHRVSQSKFVPREFKRVLNGFVCFVWNGSKTKIGGIANV
jgi:hypothetical protein